MKILSLDTTNNLASVAIQREGVLLSYAATTESSSQAEKLFSLIAQCLGHAKLKLSDIDLISLTNGPGSFTGVRIGLAAALGMQISSKHKFISLSNFQVLAYNAKGRGKIGVVLDARREQVYYQSFDEELRALTEAKLIDIKDLSIINDMIFIGDGMKYFPEYKCDLMMNVDAKMVAQASEYFLSQGTYGDLKPLYIREPDIGQAL